MRQPLLEAEKNKLRVEQRLWRIAVVLRSIVFMYLSFDWQSGALGCIHVPLPRPSFLPVFIPPAGALGRQW